MNVYAGLSALAISAAMGASGTWWLQGLRIDVAQSSLATETERHKSDIETLKLEHANERIASQQAARVEAERRIATQRAADLKAQAASRTFVVDRDRIITLGSGLRDTTAAMRATDEGGAACHQQVSALTVVFDQCVERYGVMAGHAQEWYIEAVKQNEAAQ